MFQQFVGRHEEIELLENEYKKDNSTFVIIYGRRRVGKTELVNQYSKNKDRIYYLADQRPEIVSIKEMQKAMSFHVADELFSRADINDWVQLFDEFTKRVDKKIVIIIDEFPYLIQINKALPSIFQKIWDTNLSKKNVQLILLGSSISMMEEHLLNYKAPLYGRRTAQIELKSLKIVEAFKFWHKSAIEDIISKWAITDGIPLYMNELSDEETLEKSLVEALKVGRLLYQEAEMLLKQEVREPSIYFAILKAIAYGRCTYGEIVNITQFDKSIVSKYLDNLVRLHIIQKEYPVTQKKELRNTHYEFEDNYYKFWFRIVYPNKQLIEEGKQKELIKSMKQEINLHISKAFEKACKQILWTIKTPIKFNRIGKWWHKDEEIDLIAVNERNKELLFVECKWQDKVDGVDVFKKLQEKAKSVEWNNESRKEHYLVIAKSFKNKNEFCIDLREIEKRFYRY